MRLKTIWRKKQAFVQTFSHLSLFLKFSSGGNGWRFVQWQAAFSCSRSVRSKDASGRIWSMWKLFGLSQDMPSRNCFSIWSFKNEKEQPSKSSVLLRNLVPCFLIILLVLVLTLQVIANWGLFILFSFMYLHTRFLISGFLWYSECIFKRRSLFFWYQLDTLCFLFSNFSLVIQAS